MHNCLTMTAITTHPAPHAVVMPDAGRLWRTLRSAVSGASIRNLALTTTCAFMVSAALLAEEWAQDWVPDVLRMPADAEVLASRSIGSTVRMFKIATHENADDLFAEWEEALRNNGYSIDQAADELVKDSIEFSGPHISNAKIAVAPSRVDGRTVLEFDATLP
jgi:hypothetical protein